MIWFDLWHGEHFLYWNWWFDHCSIDVHIHDISIKEKNDTVIIISKGPLDVDYINVLEHLDTFNFGDVKYELLCEVIIEENDKM